MFVGATALDLDLLRCFVTVVESGGFTQAAKRLRLTQSAITLKIKRLEDLLERRLFSRTTKPPELSAEGEIVLGYASRLLELNREMIQCVAKPAGADLLRLGIVEHFGYHFLPIWLSEFKREWPNVRLVTDMGTTADLLKRLEEERFDLVIASAGYTALAQYKMASSLDEQHLQKETPVWVQAENSKIDPGRDPLPLVMFGSVCRFRPIGLEALRKAGRSWEIVFDGASLPSVQTAVQADLGLSILSPISLVPGIEIVGKKAGLPALPSTDLALYSRKSNSHPMVERLASFIASAVARWENDACQADVALSSMTPLATRLVKKESGRRLSWEYPI
jgi:DNA-binding transcriptional LysR family regulator